MCSFSLSPSSSLPSIPPYLPPPGGAADGWAVASLSLSCRRWWCQQRCLGASKCSVPVRLRQAVQTVRDRPSLTAESGAGKNGMAGRRRASESTLLACWMCSAKIRACLLLLLLLLRLLLWSPRGAHERGQVQLRSNQCGPAVPQGHPSFPHARRHRQCQGDPFLLPLFPLPGAAGLLLQLQCSSLAPPLSSVPQGHDLGAGETAGSRPTSHFYGSLNPPHRLHL